MVITGCQYLKIKPLIIGNCNRTKLQYLKTAPHIYNIRNKYKLPFGHGHNVSPYWQSLKRHCQSIVPIMDMYNFYKYVLLNVYHYKISKQILSNIFYTSWFLQYVPTYINPYSYQEILYWHFYVYIHIDFLRKYFLKSYIQIGFLSLCTLKCIFSLFL